MRLQIFGIRTNSLAMSLFIHPCCPLVWITHWTARLVKWTKLLPEHGALWVKCFHILWWKSRVKLIQCLSLSFSAKRSVQAFVAVAEQLWLILFGYQKFPPFPSPGFHFPPGGWSPLPAPAPISHLGHSLLWGWPRSGLQLSWQHQELGRLLLSRSQQFCLWVTNSESLWLAFTSKTLISFSELLFPHSDI